MHDATTRPSIKLIFPNLKRATLVTSFRSHVVRFSFYSPNDVAKPLCLPKHYVCSFRSAQSSPLCETQSRSIDVFRTIEVTDALCTSQPHPIDVAGSLVAADPVPIDATQLVGSLLVAHRLFRGL